MRVKLLLLLTLLAALSTQAFAQTYGSLELDVENGNTYAAYLTFDASGFPVTTLRCTGGGQYQPPTCITYYSSASATVTITTPTNRTATASQGGLTMLQPEADLAMSGEKKNIVVTANVVYSCGGTTGGGFFSNYFEYAETRFQYLGAWQNCHTRGVVEVCDYSITSWCTPETTPPDYNDSLIQDIEGFTQPTYWDAIGVCVRLGPTSPWIGCAGVGAAIPTHINLPKSVCTKS